MRLTLAGCALMDTFVTGATGFIGRHLLEHLLLRGGDVHVLVREQSAGKIAPLAARLGHPGRLKPVIGDLSAPRLGIDEAWTAAHKGAIGHAFHLAAIYDMEASEEANEIANVGGTRATVQVVNALEAGCLHHVSSVAAAGDYDGRFTEAMFDEGQPLKHPYHRTKFESEKIAREESTVPWRVYRPAIVLGSSVTGEIDKLDGPYYFFPLLKASALLPGRLRVPVPRLGATNMVPVDFVAAALDRIAHLPDGDGQAFHLVNPEPQPTLAALNIFARAAGAPQLVGVLPRAALDVPMRVGLLRETLLPAATGVPGAALEHADFTATFDCKRTLAALFGTGIAVPPLEAYAPILYDWWKANMA